MFSNWFRKAAAPVPPPKGAVPTAPPAMPIDLVLANIPGGSDVSTLCAAACVSREWRSAVSDPPLWKVIKGVPNSASDKQLLSVVARAKHKVTSIDVHACDALTERGFGAAIKGQPRLKAVDARCTELSGSALGAYLRGRKLRSLKAHGVPSGSESPTEAADEINDLRRVCSKVDVKSSCVTFDHDGDACCRLCIALPTLELDGVKAYSRGCPKGGCWVQKPVKKGKICAVW